jgi:eukaryotic-like serine/threonine-protein kinase
MDDPRLARLTELFDRALDLPQALRREFLENACGADTELYDELVSLIEAHESSTGYFEGLAEQIVSPAFAAISGSTPFEDDPDLLQRLQQALGDSYRIGRELGGGAMSRVFLAHETKLDRKVVIKVLPPQMMPAMSPDRFRREIHVAAQLQHPHIVPLLTSDSAGEFLYYTMPFIAGESLRARLARDGALPVEDARRIWRNVLDALAHAHTNGVVHRDIKPANILLSGRNALITDFGIALAIEAAAGDAQATAAGLTVGTPAYMAPEQITGEPEPDQRVDIYAAGLVMYEMLEGRSPFPARTKRDLVLARLAQEPRPIERQDCPAELAELVMSCLAREPAARPASAESVLAVLENPSVSGPGEARRGRRGRRGRRVAYALGAAVLVSAAVAARELRSTGPGSPLAVTAVTPSLAVLPPVNLGTDPDDSALARGMTEELIATLSRVPELRVIGATSVFALSERRLSAKEIADSLRVSHILESGLQRVGTRMRIQVRLLDARDASAQWGATYDRDARDVFAVQDEISRAVASELDLRLVGAAGRGSARRRRPPTANIQAYESYLRGMNFTFTRSPGALQQALLHLNRAIEQDSSFAAPYAALVNIYVLMAGDAPDSYREYYTRAEAAAIRAVALDDSLAEAHVALGWARIGTRRWADAEAALIKGVALDPRASRGYEGLARINSMTWRPAEQLAAARRALEIEPFSQNAIREMAIALSFNGRCEEAIALLQPLKSLEPPFAPARLITGLCHAQKQQWPQAVADFRWTVENTRARAALAFLGYGLARAGQEVEAKVILADMLSGRRYSHGAFGIAIVYAGLRDYDQAFHWLERAWEEGSVRVYLWDPAFADLHRDPRFEQLQRRMQG